MTTKARKLDSIDRKLLYILQRDGRISNVELAEQVALSPTPCLERVRRLEKEGYIKQYVALLDANKLQSNTQAFIQVLLTSTTTDNLKKFGDLMRGITEVESCIINRRVRTQRTAMLQVIAGVKRTVESAS